MCVSVRQSHLRSLGASENTRRRWRRRRRRRRPCPKPLLPPPLPPPPHVRPGSPERRLGRSMKPAVTRTHREWARRPATRWVMSVDGRAPRSPSSGAEPPAPAGMAAARLGTTAARTRTAALEREQLGRGPGWVTRRLAGGGGTTRITDSDHHGSSAHGPARQPDDSDSG